MQLTRDLFAIAKFLLDNVLNGNLEEVDKWNLVESMMETLLYNLDAGR